MICDKCGKETDWSQINVYGMCADCYFKKMLAEEKEDAKRIQSSKV